MKLLKLLFRQSRFTVILGIVAAAIGGLTTTGLFVLINDALTRKESRFGQWQVWIFFTLCLAVPLSRYISSYLLVKLGQKAAFDLRMQLTRQILTSPLRRLEEHGSPRLLTALSNDVFIITNTVLSLPALCLHITLLVGSLVYLGVLSWLVLLIVVGVLGLGYFTYTLPLKAANRIQSTVRGLADTLQKHFREVTDGIKELKLHDARQRAFLRSVESTGQESLSLNVKMMSLYGVATGWGQLLFFMAVGILLFVLPKLQPIDQPTLTGYAVVLLYMLTPLQVILGDLPQVNRAGTSLQNLERLGLSLTEPAEYPPAQPPALWSSVELVGAVHSFYREDKTGSFTLGPIDLTISPGELLFLIGGNGSGKTTLAKMILGLYLPESGHIALDGKPLLKEEDLRPYRQLFSVVFSDFYLFSSLLGLETPEIDARAQTYLEQLRLDQKVEVKDGKLSTTALSQGQRKRLALLTAYLEDRPIYLFDEWAADQDPIFKEIFYHHLLPELRGRGKTVIVISHDDRYYDVADRIVKLDYGQIEYDRKVGSLHAAEATA